MRRFKRWFFISFVCSFLWLIFDRNHKKYLMSLLLLRNQNKWRKRLNENRKKHLRVAHFCGTGSDKKRPFVCLFSRVSVEFCPKHATMQNAAITKATFICKWKWIVGWISIWGGDNKKNSRRHSKQFMRFTKITQHKNMVSLRKLYESNGNLIHLFHIATEHLKISTTNFVDFSSVSPPCFFSTFYFHWLNTTYSPKTNKPYLCDFLY